MTGYSSQHRQQARQPVPRAERAPTAFPRIREAEAEHSKGWTDDHTFTLEVKAALRDLDRRKPQNQGTGR